SRTDLKILEVQPNTTAYLAFRGESNGVVFGRTVSVSGYIAPQLSPTVQIKELTVPEKIPLMQHSLPVRLRISMQGTVYAQYIKILHNGQEIYSSTGTGSYGSLNGVLPFCPPSKVKIGDVLVNIPPIRQCPHNATYKAYILAPVQNTPGARGNYLIPVLFYGVDNQIFASYNFIASLERSYAIQEGAIYSILIDYAPQQITFARMRNNNVSIVGTVNSGIAVFYPMYGKATNESWILELCTPEGCINKTVVILGEPSVDLRCDFCGDNLVGGPPPSGNDPTIQFIFPTEGTTLSPGTYDFQVKVTVDSSDGVDKVDIYVKKYDPLYQDWIWTVGYCERAGSSPNGIYSCSFTLSEVSSYPYKAYAYLKASSGKTAQTEIRFYVSQSSAPPPTPTPTPTPTPACPDA
ncbi:MAG: Ig-like domain-containing protein, partial [Archaeoglobaceae archaeon]